MINPKIVDTVKKLQNASRNMPKVWDGRNCNGKPRTPKFNVNIQKIPDLALIATEEF